ncbi:MAG TPA: L-threonylcarbamoyladenylate synthase [Opitutaceae bacterium]|nr:L-threonylcarbamoyladenylate synthase [Opitutaceae bacterium]
MKTRVLPPTPAALRRIAAELRRGRLAAVPTETVYGLAANALDARACRAIFRAKRRPAHDPLIVHVSDLAAAEELAEFNDAARRLARAFWPGPLTLVLPKKALIPAVVTSGGDSVALRCPAHPVMRRLLRAAKVPLAAPSANPFGYVSPTTAAHVVEGLGGRIPYVIDGGPSRVGVESTIADLRDPRRPRVLRPGAVSAAQLGRVLRLRVASQPPTSPTAPVAPGMLARHYSPRTPLELVTVAAATARARRLAPGEAVIFFRRPNLARRRSEGTVAWLTDDGSAAQAARRLYGVLRELDHRGLRRAFVALAPASAGPLGAAINDRLRRAARRS